MSGDALAAPDNFQGSEPSMVVVNIATSFGTGPNGFVTIYETQKPWYWRIRAVVVRGNVGGNAGTCKLSLQCNIEFAAGDPWTNAANDSGVNAGSPQAIPAGDEFRYTWSTEIGDNYLGAELGPASTAMLGFPLVYLPGHTSIDIQQTGSGGFNGDLSISDGFIQIEKFPTSAVSGGQGGSLENVYLLPTTI